jgi:hypothetical protein
MKKLLYWEKIQAGLNEIEQGLHSQDLDCEVRILENKKKIFLVEIFLLIEHFGRNRH